MNDLANSCKKMSNYFQVSKQYYRFIICININKIENKILILIIKKKMKMMIIIIMKFFRRCKRYNK